MAEDSEGDSSLEIVVEKIRWTTGKQSQDNPQKLLDSVFEVKENDPNSKLFIKHEQLWNHIWLNYFAGSVVVRCSQNGKIHTVKAKDLSREDDEPLGDLLFGEDLILQYRGRPYSVKFVKYNGKLSQAVEPLLTISLREYEYRKYLIIIMHRESMSLDFSANNV